MWPSAAAPQRGIFVRDQVEALRRRGDVEVEVFAFPPGPRALLRASRRSGAATRGAAFDVVHAHFGLAALPALAARRGPVVVTLHGNDLFVRRSKLVTRAALPFTALPAAVSRAFSRNLPGAGHGGASPCCRSASRSTASARSRAPRRARGSGSTPPGRTCCSRTTPHGRSSGSTARARRPATCRCSRWARRPGGGPVLDQRRERGARAVAGRGLRALGDRGARLRRAGVRDAGRDPPGRAPRDRGRVLRGVGRGALARALAAGLEAADPRVDGRARAELFSADRMAGARRGGLARGDRANTAAGRRRAGPAYTRRFERIGDRAPDRP